MLATEQRQKQKLIKNVNRRFDFIRRSRRFHKNKPVMRCQWFYQKRNGSQCPAFQEWLPSKAFCCGAAKMKSSVLPVSHKVQEIYWLTPNTILRPWIAAC